MAKRSTFLDMLGAPKTDLRTKPKCSGCGVLVTRQNFAMAGSAWGDGWTDQKYYCRNCYLKPEALSLTEKGD